MMKIELVSLRNSEKINATIVNSYSEEINLPIIQKYPETEKE